MGTFTTVVTHGGTDVKFKTGDDLCETVRIGQEIPGLRGKRRRYDGAYRGLSGGAHPHVRCDHWVVVVQRRRVVFAIACAEADLPRVAAKYAAEYHVQDRTTWFQVQP